MSDIEINFINESDDLNNSEVVIFQQNQAETFDELAVAWMVIKNCGRGDYHPFHFPMVFEVSANDTYGNHSHQLAAYAGDAFEMVLAPSGDVLQPATTPSANPKDIEIRNNLPNSTINANIYRSGKLLACQTALARGQKAAFQFHPVIYIGVTAQIEEGQVMNAAMVAACNTQFNLFGISSADIVMRGGNNAPFTFSMENIKMLKEHVD